jgi:hypothetical protein
MSHSSKYSDVGADPDAHTAPPASSVRRPPSPGSRVGSCGGAAPRGG